MEKQYAQPMERATCGLDRRLPPGSIAFDFNAAGRHLPISRGRSGREALAFCAGIPQSRFHALQD